MYHIYKITNLINGKLYIGKTHLPNIQKRFRQHISDSKKPHRQNRPLYRAINKYGAENFKVELVETVENDTMACEKEMYYINLFDTYNNGYNATFGGDGTSYLNREHIKEMLLKFPNKTAKEMADICDCCRDTVLEVAKENGIHIKTSQELTREKTKRAICQIDRQTGEILNTFDSVENAANYIKATHNIKSKNNSMRAYISQVARGIKKQAFGYHWEYIDNENDNKNNN